MTTLLFARNAHSWILLPPELKFRTELIATARWLIPPRAQP
jgi:hypothetical protein